MIAQFSDQVIARLKFFLWFTRLKPNTPFLKMIAQFSDQVIARLKIFLWFTHLKPNTPFLKVIAQLSDQVIARLKIFSRGFGCSDEQPETTTPLQEHRNPLMRKTPKSVASSLHD